MGGIFVFIKRKMLDCETFSQNFTIKFAGKKDVLPSEVIIRYQAPNQITEHSSTF